MKMHYVLEKFYLDFQEFMYSNRVVVAAAGWAIGAASNTYIQHFMNEVVLPIIIAVTTMFQAYLAQILSPSILGYLSILFRLLWLSLVWVVSIFMAFFILEYILNRSIIGTSSNLNTDDRYKFIQAEINAKRDENIIPTKQQVDMIKQERDIIRSSLLSGSLLTGSSYT